MRFAQSSRAISSSALGRRLRRGFTLIETAMAMVIVGVAVGATMELLTAGTMSNLDATELTTGVELANNIHEIAIGLPFYDPQNPNSTNTKEADVTLYDNIWDLNGCVFSPPLDVRRLSISGYSNWTQSVTVSTVAANNLDSTRPNDITVTTARVTVTITHQGHFVYQTSWLVVAPSPS